jgi:Protein of unknown function (DUF1418).
MRSLGALPKSVLILEAVGMVLLGAAWLSLNDYVTLPAPVASQGAAVVMIFVGIILMLPAAFALFWGMAQTVAPQLMGRNKKTPSMPDKEKHDDADN